MTNPVAVNAGKTGTCRPKSVVGGRWSVRTKGGARMRYRYFSQVAVRATHRPGRLGVASQSA